MSRNLQDLKQRRAQQAEDGAKAMAEYLAEQEQIRVRTAKLRAARLAKEAAEARGNGGAQAGNGGAAAGNSIKVAQKRRKQPAPARKSAKA